MSSFPLQETPPSKYFLSNCYCDNYFPMFLLMMLERSLNEITSFFRTAINPVLSSAKLNSNHILIEMENSTQYNF